MSRAVVALLVAGCAGPMDPARDARILDTLAEDNYVWARREPALTRMKLRKMQRGPYEWLRGTAALYWRDVLEPGGARPATAFGDPRSSRVLLVGDAHVENVGTFRAGDGTMFVDWNDFDATGYGPFGAELRRLGAAFVVVATLGAPGDDALATELVRLAASGYADAIATLARGERIGTLGFGADRLFDDELTKAQSRGDRRHALDELAPVVDGARALAVGDLEPIADDGVIEDRVEPVSAEQSVWIDRAIAQWRAVEPAAGTVKLRARRIGSGVASYAVHRFQVVLEGPSASLDDDVLIELKETRDGLVMRGVPMLQAADWDTPAARAVDTQRRLQARPDADVRLGHARVGGLSLKIRDREAYQRGIDAPDLAELAAAAPDRLRALAGYYGALLGRAHGQALTADQVPGHTVIAPQIVGRQPAFADEIAQLAVADARQIIADHALMQDRDLGAVVIDGGAR